MASSSSRRPSFSEADDGLASIAGNPYPHRHLFVSRAGCYNAASSSVTPRRRASLRNLASFNSYAACSSSPRSIPGRIFDTRFDEALINPPHFLDSCFLCKKPLGGNRDIFMYRGDIPFCSEECRNEQIEMDEAGKWRKAARFLLP
uniref:FLZ-type domain-containing protein n=1 Tax=Fallopia multiflora TaxID=76025 RepID=A0A023W2L2_9CARY|nr:hypothetical protein [Fallopia multiflora]